MPQVFISYSHNDRYIAESLAERLQAEGYQAWIDVDGLIGGDVWERAIEKAIAGADRLLVVVTATALSSEWVGKEIGIARATATGIIPLIMGKFEDVPAVLTALGVADLQAVDFQVQGLQLGYERLKRALPAAEPRAETAPQPGMHIEQTVGSASGSATIIGIQHNYAVPEDPRDAASRQRAYLWSWFGKSWAKVSLADIAERGGQVSLLDIYVPLPVNFKIVVKTEAGRIVDWWVENEGQPEREWDGEPAKEIREWASLRVGEAELLEILEGVQQQVNKLKEELDDGEYPFHMEAHDAASVQPRMVLVGDPGSGKSSFVRHLALCLAGAQLREMGAAEVPANASLEVLRDWLLGAYTPIYIELRDLVNKVFAELPKDKGVAAALPSADDFWRYVKQYILGDTLGSYEPDLLKRLMEGGAIILLDGLDEVADAADPRRREQMKALVASLERFQASRIIITSRPYAYNGDWRLEGFGRVDLEPLSPERLEELAQALFGVLLPGEAEAEAAAFFEGLETIKDVKLRDTPLFFTLLAAIWLDTPGAHRLPETRGELYRKAVDLMLAKWTQRKGISLSLADMLGLTVEQLRGALEEVAYRVHSTASEAGDTTEFEADLIAKIVLRVDETVRPRMVWKHLEQRAGILVSGRPDHFRFAHRNLQEHLAGCWLTNEDKKRKPAEEVFPAGLANRVVEKPDLWQEVARLAVDELVYSGREGEVWRLLPELFKPYLRGTKSGAAAQAVVLAGEMVIEHRLAEREWDEYSGEGAVLKGLYTAFQAVIEDSGLTPAERAAAGRALGLLGDPRRGVCVEDGVPDILWCDIPAGEYRYQKDQWVTLPAYRIAKYPITFMQFQAFLDAEDGFRNDVWWVGMPEEAADWNGEVYRVREMAEQQFAYANHPRETVSWYQAVAFCRWLSVKVRYEVRLPTEQEWEVAARYPDGREYPWGDEYISGYANIDETKNKVGPHYLGRTTPVGIYPDGTNPANGVCDLSGNVWEWCLNKYRNPEVTELDDSIASRVLRGGAWSYRDYDARAAYRYYSNSCLRFNFIGFRVVCRL